MEKFKLVDGFIYEMFMDMVIVLEKDRDWGVCVLPSLDASDFELYGFDAFIKYAQEYVVEYGSTPRLGDYVEAEGLHVCDVVDELKTRVVSEERAEVVKSFIQVWEKLKSIISIWGMTNNIVTGEFEASDVMTTVNNIIDVAKRLDKSVSNPGKDCKEPWF